MEVASNPGIVPLAEALFVEMRESGFGSYCLTCTARYAKHLSDFMDREDLRVYDEMTGSAFLEEFCQTHHGATHQAVHCQNQCNPKWRWIHCTQEAGGSSCAAS